MAEFSELIKNFNKIRDYMRDFYICGFKSRNEFKAKSARTYDNEKRRCESYLGASMKWTYSGGNKVSFVSVDCGKAPVNPLFSAWKSKSFTANDILLHFYISDALSSGWLGLDELTNYICEKSGAVIDIQTVRMKCNEYTEYGILQRCKKGKGYFYKTADERVKLSDDVLEAAGFFQASTLGVIGSYILDKECYGNGLFIFKHHYIAHTLDDGILLDILRGIHQKRKLRIERMGTMSGERAVSTMCPVKIFVSSQSGRRYLCVYSQKARRFTSYRLDSIKSVELQEPYDEADDLNEALERNRGKLWGVSFEGDRRNEFFSLTLFIDEEREPHILRRLEKEGRGGRITHIDKNTYKYEKEVFDANEALPWVKTFIGRIIDYDAPDALKKKLRKDILQTAELYGLEARND